MNRDGVTDDEPADDRLSILSALGVTQLTTRGMLPRRSPLTIGFSHAPPGHRHSIHTSPTCPHITVDTGQGVSSSLTVRQHVASHFMQ